MTIFDRIENAIRELGDNATFKRVCQEVKSRKKTLTVAQIEQEVFYRLANKLLHFERIKNATILRRKEFTRPVFIFYKNYISMIIEDPNSTDFITYPILANGEPANQWCSTQSPTKDRAIFNAVYHIAQQDFDPTCPRTFPVGLLKHVKAKDFVELNMEWKGWVEFQVRFRQARDAGLNDNYAHYFAGRNPGLIEVEWKNDAEDLEVLKRLQYLSEKSEKYEQEKPHPHADGHDADCKYLGSGFWDCGQTDHY